MVEGILEISAKYALIIVVIFKGEKFWIKILLVIVILKTGFFDHLAWTIFGFVVSPVRQIGRYHNVLQPRGRRALELLGMILESVRQ